MIKEMSPLAGDNVRIILFVASFLLFRHGTQTCIELMVRLLRVLSAVKHRVGGTSRNVVLEPQILDSFNQIAQVSRQPIPFARV
jgi:hypothetical protein